MKESIDDTLKALWSAVKIDETGEQAFIDYLFLQDLGVISDNLPKVLTLAENEEDIITKLTRLICEFHVDDKENIIKIINSLKHFEKPHWDDLVDEPLRDKINDAVKILEKLTGSEHVSIFQSTKYLLSPEFKDYVTESISTEHIGTMSPDVFDDVDEARHARPDLVISNFQKKFLEFCDTESKDIKKDIALLNEMYELSESMDILTEASRLGKGARNLARKGERASRKAVHGLRKAGHESKRVKVIAKKIPGNFDNLINSTFGSLKRMDHDERRKRILEGGFRFKIYKIIRNGIVLGAAWAVTPALAAIAIIVHVAKDKTLDARARNELIKELEAELAITKEKVRDADQKGDSRKKYQLMRIENRLERDLERIKFSLKGNRAPQSRGVN